MPSDQDPPRTSLDFVRAGAVGRAVQFVRGPPEDEGWCRSAPGNMLNADGLGPSVHAPPERVLALPGPVLKSRKGLDDRPSCSEYRLGTLDVLHSLSHQVEGRQDPNAVPLGQSRFGDELV